MQLILYGDSIRTGGANRGGQIIINVVLQLRMSNLINVDFLFIGKGKEKKKLIRLTKVTQHSMQKYIFISNKFMVYFWWVKNKFNESAMKLLEYSVVYELKSSKNRFFYIYWIEIEFQIELRPTLNKVEPTDNLPIKAKL